MTEIATTDDNRPDGDVRFWGVRGSLPSPGPDTVIYGGDTPCIEILTAKTRIILDCGSGMRRLGDAMMKARDDRETIILLGHPHFDHVCGMPFFAPIFSPDWHFRLGAAPPHDISELMKRIFSQPFFPVEAKMLGAEISCFEVSPNGRMALNDEITIITRPLNHPGSCTGFRVETADFTIAYCSDTEHVEGETDSNVIELMKGADLAIYDSAYTAGEYKNHIGWGHSTPDEGICLASLAGAKRLALFHHNPDRTDAQMAAIEATHANAPLPVFAARDGMTLRLRPQR